MMRKLLLIFGLLAFVVGIAYVQSSLKKQRIQESYRTGYDAGTVAGDRKAELDSMRSILESTTGRYNDSLNNLVQRFEIVIDSLEQLVIDQTREITGLTETSRKLREKATARTNKPIKKAAENGPSHAEILKYYKQKYRNLPQDLSSYERKVALREIQQDTATRFKITLVELDKIFQRYDLN
jgi:hypothetical protein